MSDERLEHAIRDLLAQRRPGASICPSEVARAVWPDGWRFRMHRVRSAARAMVANGELDICQGGEVVDPDEARGPIRLRLSNAEREVP